MISNNSKSSKSSSLQLSKALLEQELTKPMATVSSVAEKLGCTPSAITQALAGNPELSEKILAAKVSANSQGQVLDALYDSLELKALKKLDTVMPFVTDPMKLARVAEAMNRAKRRGAPELPSEGADVVVRLVLPKMVEKKLHFGSNNEVVQVGDRALVTMPTTALLKLAEERKKEKAAELPVKMMEIL